MGIFRKHLVLRLTLKKSREETIDLPQPLSQSLSVICEGSKAPPVKSSVHLGYKLGLLST